MKDQKKRYEQLLDEMGQPTSLKDIPNRKIDYKSLIAYAKSKGMRVIDLPLEERMKFVQKD